MGLQVIDRQLQELEQMPVLVKLFMSKIGAVLLQELVEMVEMLDG